MDRYKFRMARLNAVDMRIVEEALGSGSGYVADFTNATFDAFFKRDVGVAIYDDAYSAHGSSKGKRLRAFLEEGSDDEALRALLGLRDYVARTDWKPDWQSPEERSALWEKYEDLTRRL